MANAKPLFNSIADQALDLQTYISYVDEQLETCNTILRDLQPFRRSGAMGVLATHRKSSGQIVLNETQWRIVRWRRQAEGSDGEVTWWAETVPLKGAAHYVRSYQQFRDVAGEVRNVVTAAVRLIRWRAQLVLAARNFVAAVEGHRKSAYPSIADMMLEIGKAVDRADAKLAAARREVEQAIARNAGDPRRS